MSESEPPIPAQRADVERHEKPKIEIWVVDDDPENAKIWRGIFDLIPGVTMVHFLKGEDAIGEFRRRIETGRLPQGIIMDGILNADQNSEYNEGVKLIPLIRNLTANAEKKPYIIAFSGTDGANKAMMELGADAALQKPFRVAAAMVELKKIQERATP